MIIGGAALLAGLNPTPVWAVAADLLRHRSRPGLGRQPDPDRRAVLCRLGRARGGHRHQHVRPLDGQRLGVAVFGAIVNASLGQPVGGHPSSTASGIPLSVLGPALHTVFLASGILAVLLAGAVLLMPRALGSLSEGLRDVASSDEVPRGRQPSPSPPLRPDHRCRCAPSPGAPTTRRSPGLFGRDAERPTAAPPGVAPAPTETPPPGKSRFLWSAMRYGRPVTGWTSPSGSPSTRYAGWTGERYSTGR